MDREAWSAVIYGVAKSRTWLSDWTELNRTLYKWQFTDWTIPSPSKTKRSKDLNFPQGSHKYVYLWEYVPINVCIYIYIYTDTHTHTKASVWHSTWCNISHLGNLLWIYCTWCLILWPFLLLFFLTVIPLPRASHFLLQIFSLWMTSHSSFKSHLKYLLYGDFVLGFSQPFYIICDLFHIWNTIDFYW